MNLADIKAGQLIAQHRNGARLEDWSQSNTSLRWRMQWGPSDVFLSAQGDALAVQQALEASWDRFTQILPGLMQRVSDLRQALPRDIRQQPIEVADHVAARVAASMHQACLPYAQQFGMFITSMAAVAGSIAQSLLEPFQRHGIEKAWVNNGGDIAFYCAEGQAFSVALPDQRQITVSSNSTVAGVATSGWGGRSFSFGIADAVTVLAGTAAQADAAATMIANAVNCEDVGIERRPANNLRDDTDLGDRLVTFSVPVLAFDLVSAALDHGAAFALLCQERGLIHSAYLQCQGQTREIIQLNSY